MGVGIIGTGWGGRVQAPAFKLVGLEVVALAARDPEKAERQARELGIPFATGDWRELLERDDVELVSITTPPHTHREIAIAALAAGKHVLCEKPMALDAAETEAMVAAAAERPELHALVDHELRFLPAVQAARARVESGELGALRYIEARVSGSGRADPTKPWSWWSDAEQGGGVLGAAGSHQIDLIQFVFGPATAVSGVLRTYVGERPSDTGARAVTSDDFASVRLRLADDTLADISLSAVAGADEPMGVTAHFANGALRLQRGRLLVARRGSGFEDVSPLHTVGVPEGSSGNEFEHGTVYIGRAIRQCLGDERKALDVAATFADGHRTQQLMDGARRSSATDGGWVELADERAM